jgi:hypothetical protein
VFLESQVDDLLRRIDPTAVPSSEPGAAPGAGPGANSMSPEERERFMQEIQRRMKEQKQKAPAPAGSP